ncbi:MAG TPA: TetR/AcrR family transcriptional regulator [Smithellaceae bacterium]|nr:TetR/AcrR family transcriptional regulator [Smithella sp.]HNZ32616.1 TetR/AcrR family transcriptional regulator [Smithellaceae bacterium]HNQ66493.1 TetR/AcrR family transcriptional regulator [Smithella sp.]HOS13988.1 TetR/AcrR family transcriptional regulator [Smithella sp.]HOZ62032.1 TetR/AcrR family transcriptional regulator [Smithellaceae bacterium]
MTIIFLRGCISTGKKVAVGLLERRVKEKDSRKKLILRSARSLFFKKGFNKVTVDEIAKSAELGKGSIYLYFDSKEEIYAQILLSDIDNFNRRVSVLLEKGSSATDLLTEFSYIYIDFFLNDGELFRILMAYMLQPAKMNLPEKLNAQILNANASSINVIGQILQLGVDSKEFSAEVNIKQNQNALWGLLNGIISLYIFSGAQTKRKERIYSTTNLALEIFIKGLKKA